MELRKHALPIGQDRIPMLVASVDGEPKAVFMTYQAYLDLAATLFTAIDILKASGVDPCLLEEPGEARAEASLAALTQVG